MIFRHQLPAYSPTALRALWPGRRRANVDLETTLADEFGADRVWLTDSGTSALALAIRAAATPEGGPVALPAYGCYDLATAVEAAEATAVLYDVDPVTLGPEPDSLVGALAAGADRVVVVHLYGIASDLDAVRRATESTGTSVIEDAAQGVGATWEGRPLGSFGEWSVLSFGRGKGRSAGGGGALLARGDPGRIPEAAGRVVESTLGAAGLGARDLVGWLGQWVLGRPAVYGIPASIPALRLGETIYHDPQPPRRMSAWGRHAVPAAMAAAPEESARRRTHAESLLDAVRAAPGLAPVQPPAECVAGYLRLPVRARSEAAADALRGLRRRGVMPAYPQPLPTLGRFAERVVNRGQAFPGARELAARLFTLPTHSRVTGRDLHELREAVGGIG